MIKLHHEVTVDRFLMTITLPNFEVKHSSRNGCFFFFSSRRRHTRYWRDWSSDVCSSDLELSISNGLLLPDQLVQPLFGNGTAAPLVDVGSVSGARPLSVDEHAKRHRRTSLCRSHHEVHVARVEPDRYPSGCLLEHRRVLGERPAPRRGPLVQAQPRWLGIVVGLVEALTVRRGEAVRAPVAQVRLGRSHI